MRNCLSLAEVSGVGPLTAQFHLKFNAGLESQSEY